MAFNICCIDVLFLFVGLTAQIFGECTIINPNLIVWRTHLVIGQSKFSKVFFSFLGPPSIGKPRMTAVFFVKTTEAYEVCQ